MSEGFLPPKKGYFLPKKSYVRNNDEEEDGEDSKSRKRKNEDAEDDGTNTKRSRVDDDEKKKIEEEDIFGGESSDFSSSDDDDDDYDDDDDDDDDDIDDKEGYGDGFGDDLMGDMDDRKRLYTMTEVEREAILEERRMKREAFMENKRLRRELAKAEAEKKKKKKSKTRGRLKKVGRDDSDEDSDDVDDDDDFALSDDDDEGFVSDTGKESSTFQEVEEDVVPLTTEDVNRLRFTRKKIGRFLDEPYLEKIATGAFVRYCLGMNKKTNQRTYRMCTIRGLGKPYKRVYRLNGLQTDKTFVLEQGGTSRPCKLDMISDHRITQKELDFWLRQEDDLGNKVPTREELMKRYKNIVDTVEGHVYTDQEVNEMVRLRKERNKNKITNYGIEILQIQEELQLALEKRDGGGGGEDQEDLDEKIENLKQRLKYLEEEEKERRSKRTDNVISNMHTINQKNIKYNTARAREIARKRLNEEKRTMGTVKKHDPFKRRETVVQNLWLSKPKKKERKKKEKETEDTKTSSKKEELDTVSEILGVSKVVSTDDIRSRRTKEHSRAIGTTTTSSSSTSSRNKSASSSASTKKKKQHKKKKKKKGMSLAEWKRRHQ